MLKYIVRDFFFKNLKLIHGHMEYESIDRIQTILVLFKPNTNCRVTNCSPHLNRNRKWAQQAQYNRFVREWVKELG